MIKKSGGARQKIWNLLRRRKAPQPSLEIAEICGCTLKSAETYLCGLKSHGLVDKVDDGWILLKNTGPVSPSYNVARNTLRDWNAEPRMSARELQKFIDESGLSMRAFAVKLGFNGGSSKRLADMAAGRRPVSDKVENAVREIEDEQT